ncbi:MAG: DUF6444 domain-containing protein, partial [Oscillospiraceae bacterium]|nr:DUF6444 domain-containing protein [Oscillospiraceae bacterium]
MSIDERKEFERLQQREQELMSVVAMLRDMLERTVAQNEKLEALIEELKEQLVVQATQNAELNEKLDKRKRDSHNSSKPPSSDGYSKPNPKSLKSGSTGRNPGGQKGHPGKSMKIESEIDDRQPHYPPQCENCPHREECKGRVKERRYEVDVIIRRNIICHEQMEMDCPLCGEKITGEFPKNVSGTKQYGPNLQSLAVSLNTVGAVSIDRIKKLLAECFGIDPSTGT